MSKFIEVHSKSAGVAYLINTSHILSVGHNVISFAGIEEDGYGSSYLECKESYDEIKALILNAQRERE